MNALTPPLAHRTSLLALSQFDEKTFESLCRALASKESLESGEIPDEVRNLIPQVSSGEIKKLFEALVSMHVVRSQRSLGVEEFVDGIITGITRADNPAFSESELRSAKDRLPILLRLDGSIGFSAKANDLALDFQRTFCSCRILTDIRPIFPENPSDAPTGSLITHTLKLAYHENGDHKEIFFVADTIELSKISESIQRAEKKAENLKAILGSTDLSVVDLG